MSLPAGPKAPGRGEAAVAVAHPDDESLWLSSVLAEAARIVLCFGDPLGRPDKAAARRQAVAALPLPGIAALDIPESGAGFAVDWARARPTAAGIEIADAEARRRYEANYPVLVKALRPVLAGCRAVYTHNPWGEYGHAEHIQVHRAIAGLQAELGYEVWFSNYVGAASWPLARRLGAASCWDLKRETRPDAALARRLMRVYRRHGAWTMSRWHRWPAAETLYGQAPPAERTGDRRPLDGEWLLDVAGLRWWPPPWRAAQRRLDCA